MKKIAKLIILCSVFALCVGCKFHKDPSIVYYNNSWAIKRINDSVLLAIPNGNTNTPYLLSTKTPKEIESTPNLINNEFDATENNEEGF